MVDLSPFSLTGEAKVWYDQTAGRARGDWIKLMDEFLLPFYQSVRTWNSVGKIFANGKIRDTSSYSGRCWSNIYLVFGAPFPLKQTDHSISYILSPPPHIVEITEPIKSTDHEPLFDDMPMLIMIPAMFQTCRRSISAYAQDLRHSFQMLHHRLRVLLWSLARNG